MLIEVIGRIKVDRLEQIKVKKRAIALVRRAVLWLLFLYWTQGKFGEKFKKFEVAPRGIPKTEHLNGNPLFYDNSYQLIIKMKIVIIAGQKKKPT